MVVGADGGVEGFLKAEDKNVGMIFVSPRIRKVWQKRKCGVKYGCLTISHSTVDTHTHTHTHTLSVAACV